MRSRWKGFSAAMDRAHAYIEAGADVTFVEAPVDVEQMTRIARELTVPQIINVVHGGKTPPLPQSELARMGFAATLYANAALQGALLAVIEVLGSLRDHGSLQKVSDRLATFERATASGGQGQVRCARGALSLGIRSCAS